MSLSYGLPHSTTLMPELSYLALGDSYTIGEAVAESERWPVQLAQALRSLGIALANPRIIAATGWSTDELDAAMTAQEPLGEHDLVSLLIGVNNQYRGRPVDEYRVQFSALLARATALARHRADRVLVLSIPDWGVTPFAAAQGRDPDRIAQELDAYNTAAAHICAQRQIAFIDITPLSRAAARQAAGLAADGLHPSAALYTQWMQLALPVVQRMLAPVAPR